MSYVYFIHCDRYVKIGFSYKPEQRMRGLWGSNRLLVPPDLDKTKDRVLLKAIGGCLPKDEGRLHRIFAEYRVEGEWFRATPEFIRELVNLEYETLTEERNRLRRERMAAKAALAAKAGAA